MKRQEVLQIAKPILFNTQMVKAILDGKKMVTRRVCKDGNDFTVPDMSFLTQTNVRMPFTILRMPRIRKS